MDIYLLMFIVVLIVLISSTSWLINSIIVLIRLKSNENAIKNIHMQLKDENNNVITEYSEKILEFVKMFTTQVSVLQFRTFVDNHDIEKVTRKQLQQLVSDVAETVHNSIKIDKIDFEDTLFTKEFYESYIVDTSMIIIKSLLDKVIDGDDED